MLRNSEVKNHLLLNTLFFILFGEIADSKESNIWLNALQ